MNDRTWAIVVNPSKFDDVEAVRRECEKIAADQGWQPPLWIETTEDDPGVSMTKQALDDGAEFVCAYGGDGTARAVAGALAGTGVEFGVLPAGTGNLLARNLSVPLNNVEEALRLALVTEPRPIDLGRVEVTLTDGTTLEEPFIVAAGVGLDAEMIIGTDENLKKRFKMLAYVASIGRAVWQRGFEVAVTVNGQRRRVHHARMVIACNCPSVQGGLELAAGGSLDDGQLDVVEVSPHGVFGWAAVVAKLVTGSRRGHSMVTQTAGTEAEFSLRRPVQAELDGEDVGEASSIKFRIEPGAVLVRAPRQEA